MGLANVRRRLALCYGDDSDLEISSANDVTMVRFRLPCAPVAAGRSVHRCFKLVRHKIMAAHLPGRWLPLPAVLEPGKRSPRAMVLKTLIVDDEPVARQVLREELEQIDDIALIGEAEDGLSALAAIRDSSPDLVFLDLQMPGMGGFDVIRKLPPGARIPMIVIVTAWDQYAIQAFEAGAIDYLLKPIGQERLAQAVDRAMKLRGAARRSSPTACQRPGDRGDVPGPHGAANCREEAGTSICCLNAEEVLAFEADGDLVWIITAKKRYLATQSLKMIQDKLRNTSFRRIHRNALVNIDHVRKMSTPEQPALVIDAGNGQEFIVSKRQAHTVRQLLSW